MNPIFSTHIAGTPVTRTNTTLVKAFTFLVALVLSANVGAIAQGNGGNGGNGGNPCSGNVTPRPITGNQTPCPGTYETYCIENDRGYTSFVWDVPRAHAGDPPTGWEIISGQGTNCVTVLVGEKPGTMKVTVTDPICGTKVATLPVHPGNAFNVSVTGPDSVCVDEEQTFTATISGSNGNGNGPQMLGTFTYTWTVPADWIITSGQGTSQITVLPTVSSGTVTVTANYTAPSGNGNGTNNNGNGVGGHNRVYCNGSDTASKDAVISDACGPINPLPVELVAFEAAMAQSQVLLKWTTAQEKDNKEFVIERSRDGRSFEAVGTVAGNGTTTQTMHYSFTDAKPLANDSYYRLKQVDNSGKFEYSPVRAVRNSGAATLSAAALSAFPNPTTGKVQIEFNNRVEDNATVRLASSTGQVVWTGTMRQLAAQNYTMDISRFNSGVYILIVSSDTQNLSLRITKL